MRDGRINCCAISLLLAAVCCHVLQAMVTVQTEKYGVFDCKPLQVSCLASFGVWQCTLRHVLLLHTRNARAARLCVRLHACCGSGWLKHMHVSRLCLLRPAVCSNCCSSSGPSLMSMMRTTLSCWTTYGEAVAVV